MIDRQHCHIVLANMQMLILLYLRITKITLILTPVHLLLLDHELIIYNTEQFTVLTVHKEQAKLICNCPIFSIHKNNKSYFLQAKTQMQSVHLYQRKSANLLTGLSYQLPVLQF